MTPDLRGLQHARNTVQALNEMMKTYIKKTSLAILLTPLLPTKEITRANDQRGKYRKKKKLNKSDGSLKPSCLLLGPGALVDSSHETVPSPLKGHPVHLSTR